MEDSLPTNDVLNDDDVEEEEFTSTAQVLERFEEIWLNEKFCPELLSFEQELVECLREQIKHMEENLKKLKPTDFRTVIHQMELERIRYMIASYFRIRLAKIEKFGPYLLHSKAENPTNNVMSPQEDRFAQEFVNVTEDYLKNVAIQHLPPNMRDFSLASTVEKPKLDDYVFLKVKKNTPGVLVEENTQDNREEVVDFPVGSQHIIRYRPIAHLVKNGRVKLM